MSNDLAFADDIKDKANPKSLVNICSTAIAERISAIPDDIIDLDESELEKLARVGPVERQLRVGFMAEHERCLRQDDRFAPANVYRGICTKKYFFTWIVGNSYKLAYIIRPFPGYQICLEEMLQLALDEMRKILIAPIVDKRGEFDHRIASAKISLFKDLADRRRGSATKKVEVDSKSLSLNINKDVSAKSILDIEAKIKELEAGSINTLAVSEALTEGDADE